MFIFERIFGLAVYAGVLLLICLLLLNSKISCKKLFLFYLLCLCVIAFFYKPYVTADLYRINEMLDQFSVTNFHDFYQIYLTDSRVPLAHILYWCISKTGINGLLPVFSTIVCYSIIFYVINKTQELFQISRKTVAFVLMFVMTTSIYISVIGGIRMMIALCLIMFSFFRNVVEKKNGIVEILFYIISLLMHEMSYAVVLVCIVVILLFYKTKLINKIIFFFVVIVLGTIFCLLFSDTIINIYNKFLSYIQGDEYSDFWEYIMGGIIVVTLLISLYRCSHIQDKESFYKVRVFNASAIGFIIVSLCFCFEFSMFYRFGGQLAVLFSIPSIMITMDKKRNNDGTFISDVGYKNIMFMLIVIIAFISCTRGSLSSLKFF